MITQAPKRMYVRSLNKSGAQLEKEQQDILNNKELHRQLDQVETWILNSPFTHPDFEKMVERRNNLLIKIK